LRRKKVGGVDREAEEMERRVRGAAKKKQPGKDTV
jgi:hypothetical protein